MNGVGKKVMDQRDGWILLVEDNPDDEVLMLDALQRCGVTAQIEIARDGAQALEYLLPKGQHTYRLDLPRLVLLDLKLRKISGLEVLRRLRADERTKYLVIVVLTSSSEREDIRSCYDNGANAYVRKPIDFEHFIEAVRCLEMFWMLFNETA
jgi:two-component system response regulator